MKLRTNKRLAKRANENCSCPIGYDFTKSKWLLVNTWFVEPYEGLISPRQQMFGVARSTLREIRRCIDLPKRWSYAGKSWIKTEPMFRPERFKPHESI